MEFRLQAELFAEIITRRLQVKLHVCEKVPPEGGTPCVKLHVCEKFRLKAELHARCVELHARCAELFAYSLGVTRPV